MTFTDEITVGLPVLFRRVNKNNKNEPTRFSSSVTLHPDTSSAPMSPHEDSISPKSTGSSSSTLLMILETTSIE